MSCVTYNLDYTILQNMTVTTMSKMADSFKLMVEEERPQSVEEELQAAEGNVERIGSRRTKYL